jgi:hypothetical protein
MGIADFGVTGAQSTASAYEYSTSSFEGRAAVTSMDVTISGSSQKITAFELNEVLVLQLNGVNYSYWIQNGLHVDAASRLFMIGGAYVWNFSAPGAVLSSGELQGNASSVLVSDTYYFIPGCGHFAGQCSTLSWPTNLTGRVVTSTSAGIPYVAYQYDLGSAWVTYDNVSFPHMAGATDVGFVVDGFQATPIRPTLFYDAEWDWVAAGGGSSGVVKTSDLAMSLYFWNGQNFQAVPSAWDFGGDSGETSSNVTELRSADGPDGVPNAHVSNGAGSLGVLYNSTTVGFLNLTIPSGSPQVLHLNGTPVPVPAGSLNLTLVSGAYSVSLQNYSNSTEEVSISPGATTFANLSGAGRIAFAENGLPVGTPWGVTVDGLTQSSHGPFVVLNVPNGTFPIGYVAVPGYVRNSSDPVSLTMPSASPVGVNWRPFTFEVPITEVGLPPSTDWWVSAGGILVRGNGTSLDVAAPNGSTPFEAGASYAFVASPESGWINGTGGHFGPISIEFSYRYGFIAGNVTPSNATITIDGAAQTLAAGAFNLSVLPGTYTVAADAAGYEPQTIAVEVTAGNVSTEQFVLKVAPAPVTSNPGSANVSVFPAPVLIAGVGVAVAALAIVAVLLHRRRARSR